MWAKKKKREKKIEALSNISNGLRKGIKSCKFGKEVIDQLCIRSQDLELFLHTSATQDTWKTSWNKEATACLLGEEVRHGCAVLQQLGWGAGAFLGRTSTDPWDWSRERRQKVSSKMLKLERDEAIPEDEVTHLLKVGGTFWRAMSQVTNSKESLCL